MYETMQSDGYPKRASIWPLKRVKTRLSQLSRFNDKKDNEYFVMLTNDVAPLNVRIISVPISDVWQKIKTGAGAGRGYCVAITDLNVVDFKMKVDLIIVVLEYSKLW